MAKNLKIGPWVTAVPAFLLINIRRNYFAALHHLIIKILLGKVIVVCRNSRWRSSTIVEYNDVTQVIVIVSLHSTLSHSASNALGAPSIAEKSFVFDKRLKLAMVSWSGSCRSLHSEFQTVWTNHRKRTRPYVSRCIRAWRVGGD